MNEPKLTPSHAFRAALSFLVACAMFSPNAFSQDPDFHIYMAFGQSNMEGNGAVPATEKIGVDPRWRVMAAVNCSNLNRVKGSWYTAVPPLCRCNTGMTPADYFGRTLVDSLPQNIKVGVINVSVAGSAIEMFDKDKYLTYINAQPDWMKNIAGEYGGNPYAALVALAKQAQNDGVIKGILLHQGESGSSTNQWANEVKIIYNNLIQDLGLDAGKTPLLAGDLVNTSAMVKNLPTTLPNSYVISSQGLGKNSDNLHFSPDGYKEFGKRYAATMLAILKAQGITGIRGEHAFAGYSLNGGLQYGGDGRSAVTFEIPRRTLISLKVYDLKGGERAVIAAGEYAAGKHTVALDRGTYPSGLGILHLRADGISISQTAFLDGNPQ